MATTIEKWPAGLPQILRGDEPVCPACEGTSFPLAEASGMDGVLRLTGLVPVRCGGCGARYYASVAVADRTLERDAE